MPSIEGNQFDERDFRRGAWHQTATMVALLTTRAGERQNVMACEWAMIVTLNPLRFVVSVGPHHATHALIEESGEFGLSFCTDRQARLAHIAGSYSLNDTNKWALGKFPTYAAKTIAAQMIADCTLNAECKVISTQPLGDHTVFTGEAQWARYDPALQPLLYSAGKYWSMGAQLPKE